MYDLTGNWFLGSAWEPMSRGSASFAEEILPRLQKKLCLVCGGKLEAEPPDLRYQAEPGNE